METVVDCIFDLSDGVLVGALDQQRHGFWVFAVLHEGEFVFPLSPYQNYKQQ